MDNICEKLLQIEKLIELSTQVHIGRQYKDELEWWVLGRIVKILKENNLPFPIHAEKRNPPDADFITYDDKFKIFKPMELTEVIESGRRRSDEYKKDKKNDKNNDNSVSEFVKKIDKPWETFINNLREKCLMRYENNCWLLVYHNITWTRISGGIGFWHLGTLHTIDSWFKSKEERFSFLTKIPYEKILVLNSSGLCLIEIYPKLDIIESKYYSELI